MMRWHKRGLTLAPGEARRLTKEKMAGAMDSLCLKWWVVLRAGVNQYPSHLKTLEGWQRWPSSSIGASEGGGAMARGSLVEEFSFRDGEGQTYIPAPGGDGGEKPL